MTTPERVMRIEYISQDTDDNTRDDSIVDHESETTENKQLREEIKFWKQQFATLAQVSYNHAETNRNLIQGIRLRESQSDIPQLQLDKTDVKNRGSIWSLADDMKLRIHKKLCNDWNEVSNHLNHTPQECEQRYEILAATPSSKEDQAARALAHTYERFKKSFWQLIGAESSHVPRFNMTSNSIDPQLLNIPMNKITGHTRLHREEPPDDLIRNVEGWFTSAPKKQEANLQWARASYGTTEDKLLQEFLNHGNIVATNVDALLGSESCAGLPVMVHYLPNVSHDGLSSRVTPYWIAPQVYDNAYLLIRPLRKTIHLPIYNTYPNKLITEVSNADIRWEGTSPSQISLYPFRTKISLPWREETIFVCQMYSTSGESPAADRDRDVIPFMTSGLGLIGEE
ncbi:uncharacterized protein BHQ10_007519 [Talaromyces amestolkiae]|uniref:Myb-like domain-containing protein n=1 Tax=Talaromyces amestolkiae TaxID=1196081 RepID=A0A364L6S0_TALAM|nr:uncharacterized protein BHQ10_007519 [Talaromyces amestolkiae]RAO71507.1 hypothetical protein BHQ10_007519 [Talaromyces amestolkiae]